MKSISLLDLHSEAMLCNECKKNLLSFVRQNKAMLLAKKTFEDRLKRSAEKRSLPVTPLIGSPRKRQSPSKKRLKRDVQPEDDAPVRESPMIQVRREHTKKYHIAWITHNYLPKIYFHLLTIQKIYRWVNEMLYI